MSKYIIDTGDYLFTTDGVLVVGFDCDNKPATFYNSLDTLEELNSDYINEHYGELQDEAYRKGFEDGKKSVSEPDRIEVGDEVVFETEGAEPFVILHKYYDDAGHPSGYSYFVYAQNGEVLIFNEGDGPKKTGRHFQETNKLLEAMRTHD